MLPKAFWARAKATSLYQLPHAVNFPPLRQTNKQKVVVINKQRSQVIRQSGPWLGSTLAAAGDAVRKRQA
jgi:hypothetical protein